MALYECFDSFVAFEHYLADSGPDLDDAARMLICEYCKYATCTRAWFYYPDALPVEALASEIRNGHIDTQASVSRWRTCTTMASRRGRWAKRSMARARPSPLPRGRSTRVDGAPFQLFCDHFLIQSERTSPHSLSLQLSGGQGCLAALSVVRLKHHRLATVTVTVAGGDRVRPPTHTAPIASIMSFLPTPG